MLSPRSEDAADIRYSVVVPVYGNAPTLPAVVERLTEVAAGMDGPLEIVFVVDGSPDDSQQVLAAILPSATIPTQMLAHSRNFGSFAAIRTGMRAARGRYIGVMAADLQEPPELMTEFFAALASGEYDVAVGRRESRDDPGLSSFASKIFWGAYRRSINKDLPPGGVDVFGCTRDVAQQLVDLPEAHSSLVGLLYWIGFRRIEIPYSRVARQEGKSGWTFRKKLAYLSDSIFSFTSVPIAALTWIGAGGMLLTLLVAVVVLICWLAGAIPETGYTPLMLAILFSAFVTLYGLGIVGSYVWRTYENSKSRPSAIVMARTEYPGER